MFPDVRLLIAATFVSVVALMCGFGVFAAFHVSNEPLVRLPPAAAPQRFADDGTMAPLAFAATEPFDRRFRLTEPRPPGEAVASLLQMLERRQGADKGAQSAVDPAAATPDDDAIAAVVTSAAQDQSIDVAATEAASTEVAPDAAPIETPPTEAASPEAASTEAALTPADAPAPGTTTSAATPAVSAQPAAASEPAAAPAATISAEMPPELAEEPRAAQPDLQSATIPSIVEGEPPAEQAPPVEPATTQAEITPANVAAPPQAPSSTAPHKKAADAAKKPKHRRAARSRRAPRVVATVAAASAWPLAPANFTSQQPNFQTAPQVRQPQGVRRPKVRHAKIAARKIRVSYTASGGPRVAVPNH